MNPIVQLQAQLNQMENQLNVIQSLINSMNASNSFSRDVETAIRERIADIKNNPGAVVAPPYTVHAGDVINLPTVTGIIPMRIGKKTYNILYQ